MQHTPAGPGPESRVAPPRRRRWWRWALGALLALVILVVGGVIAAVKLQSSQPPLTLPAAAAPPAGQLAGTWRVAAGSVAGFRIRESILGVGNDVTGRTSHITGTASLATGQVSRAAFQVVLETIAVNGKTGQSQLMQSLDVAAHPDAIITLTSPVSLSAAFSSGKTMTATSAASLDLNGITRPVTLTLTARRNGRAIDAVGSLPVAFADFGIREPHGYGFFGSLASNGTAEFLLVLVPSTR